MALNRPARQHHQAIHYYQCRLLPLCPWFKLRLMPQPLDLSGGDLGPTEPVWLSLEVHGFKTLYWLF